MESPRRADPLVPALVLAVGLIGAGWTLGRGLVESRRVDRFVTVKGVAEREVEADLAFWAITLSVPSDAIGSAQEQVAGSTAQVLAFLAEFGIGPADVSRQGTQVVDRAAQFNQTAPGDLRYIVSTTLLVRTDDVAAIHEASQSVGDLLAAGVPLGSGAGYGYGFSRPTYSFTRLNRIKPDMIAEATAAARAAAQQFADDSGGRVGGIRRANQGVFVIQARDRSPGVDEAAQRFKTVRVVSTVEYYLEE
ncbi:MAG: SIMPL domain-containing protein [Gemmatimonadota bacterium]